MLRIKRGGMYTWINVFLFEGCVCWRRPGISSSPSLDHFLYRGFSAKRLEPDYETHRDLTINHCQRVTNNSEKYLGWWALTTNGFQHRYELQTITKPTLVYLKLTLPGACEWQTASVQVVRCNPWLLDLITSWIAVVRLSTLAGFGLDYEAILVVGITDECWVKCSGKSTTCSRTSEQVPHLSNPSLGTDEIRFSDYHITRRMIKWEHNSPFDI